MYFIYVEPWGVIADFDEKPTHDEMIETVEDFIWNEISYGVMDEEGIEVNLD